MIRTFDDIKLTSTVVTYMNGSSHKQYTREELRARLFPEIEGQTVTMVSDKVFGEPFSETDRLRSAIVCGPAGGGYSPWKLDLHFHKHYYGRDFPVAPVILLRGAHALDFDSLRFPPIEALGGTRVHCETYDTVWAMVAAHCEDVAGAEAMLIDTTAAAIAHHREWLTAHNSREQWAGRIRYYDYECGIPWNGKYSHRLSDYATPEEVKALTAALKELYRALGQQMREAKLRAGTLLQQAGETSDAHWGRINALPEAERLPGRLQSDRKQINQLMYRISADKAFDQHLTYYYFTTNQPKELVAPIAERYEAAREAARAQWLQELEETVDDAAWEQELRKREEHKRAIRALASGLSHARAS
jgi:hypothetical protein